MSIFRKKSRGFTLIELLVVIAIIGILASVVLASLNSARRKSRDARRVADIKQIQLALELYFDSFSQYPATLSLLAPNYIPVVPQDPLTGTGAYNYIACTTNYHLAAGLEEQTNPALNSDRDGQTICTGDAINGTLDANNATAACALGSGRSCYDVTP